MKLCPCGADLGTARIRALFRWRSEAFVMCLACLRIFGVSEDAVREIAPREQYELPHQLFTIIALARVEAI